MSHMLLRVFYEISNTPNARENIRSEVRKFVLKEGKHKQEELPKLLNNTALDKMQYLNYFVKEIL